MAEADALRMVAEVVDRFSGPLKALRAQLQVASRDGSGHAELLAKGFTSADRALAKTATTAQNVLNPALAGVGITALTVTGALAGIGAAMRNFGQSAVQVGQLGRDTGITAQQLREVQGILGKVGVDANASGAAIQQFAENMRLARNGIGPIMEFLRTQGRSAEGRAYFNQLADDLQRSKTNGEALAKALEGLERIEDPASRRKYAEEVLRLGDAARLADGHLGTLREQIERFRKDNGVLDPEMVKRAEDYERAMQGLRGSLSKLGDAIAREALPHLTDLSKSLKAFMDDNRAGVTPAIVGTIREIATWLRSVDWGKAFAEAGAGFRQFKDELSKALDDIRELLKTLGQKDQSEAIASIFREIGTAARDAATAIRTVAKALSALGDIKNGNFSDALKKLNEIDRMTDVGVGRRSNAAPSSKPTTLDEQLDAQMRGQSGSADAQRQAENLRASSGRVAQIEARQAAIRSQLGNADAMAAAGTASEAANKRAEDLRREMTKLSDELRRLRDAMPDKKAGEATVQPQSFDASSPLNGLIHNASFSGRFGGGTSMARVGNMLAETEQRRQSIDVPPQFGRRDQGGAIGRVSPRLRPFLRGDGQPGPGSDGAIIDPRTALERRDFGGGRFGLGGPMVQTRPGGPGERVGQALRGEAPTDRGMLDLITEAEGTTKRGYNDSFAHQLKGSLTDKSLDEIEQIQRGMKGSSAIGKYQFMRNTLFGRRGAPGLVDELGIDRTEKFSPQMQDRLANALIERRYQEAKRIHAKQGGEFMSHFRTSLAREWASFPGDYGQQGINGGMYPGQKASVSRDRLTASAQRWLDEREGRRPPASSEQADGEGFSKRMRAMRSFEGNDFAGRVKQLQAEADERSAMFREDGKNLIGKALKSPLTSGPTNNIDGKVEVFVAKPGPDTKVSTSASGSIFRDVKMSRGIPGAKASTEN